VSRALKLLLEAGYIKPIVTRHRTNIKALVPFTGYNITPLGRKVINDLNSLLDYKMQNLKK